MTRSLRIRALVLIAGGAALLVGTPRPSRADDQLVAHWSFDAPDLGADASGNGHAAEALSSGARRTDGRTGKALSCAGGSGLRAASRQGLQLRPRMAWECWIQVNPQAVASGVEILKKEGEYLLRVDPGKEGGRVSFFLFLDGGKAEPRVSAQRPAPGRWHHLLAQWDGKTATLWMDGVRHTAAREGRPRPADRPLELGPTASGAGEEALLIDGVRLYGRVFPEGEALARACLPEMDGLERTRDTRFGFAGDTAGWACQPGLSAAPGKDACALTVADPSGSLVRAFRDVDASRNPFLSLRMAADRGDCGRIAFSTSKGAGIVPFPLKSDGKMHTYVLDLGGHREWGGALNALALAPSDATSSVRLGSLALSAVPEGLPELEVRCFLPERAVTRAGREEEIFLVLRNEGPDAAAVHVRLEVTAGVTLHSPSSQEAPALAYEAEREFRWRLEAARAGERQLRAILSCPGLPDQTASLRLRFTPPLAPSRATYVPPPKPAPSRYLVGAYHFPGWKEDTHLGWSKVEPFPGRKPVLGWYDEEDPEVADWEIKYCLEHGINFFVYCWFRGGDKDRPETLDRLPLAHWFREAYPKSRYLDQFHFTIMWENANGAGVASADDLLANVFPFWLETYFKHPRYLKVDNKPVLFIHYPPGVRQSLGGAAEIRVAFEKMRSACRAAGFAGLTIIGNTYWPHIPQCMYEMRDEGYDYSSAYSYFFRCGHRPGDNAVHTAAEAMAKDEAYMREKRETRTVPDIPLLSMGWDPRPWHGMKTACRWTVHLDDFAVQCRRTRDAMDATGGDGLETRMVLIDNWNEWGEGHFIAPSRQFGFGYLDAIREAFTAAPGEHIDLLPEEVGRGPYDRGYARARARKGKTSWEFQTPGDPEGWQPGKQVEDLEVRDGRLLLRSTAGDPGIHGPPMRLRAERHPRVHIRMRATQSSTAELFWATDRYPAFSGEACRVFPVTGDGEFHEYHLDLGGHPRWRGWLNQFRFDPGSTADCRFEIDHIRLEGP